MDHAALNKQLALVFQNGRGEAGLEVGTDPGLPTGEHIQIPKCLIKRWVATREETPGSPQATDPEVSSGEVFVHNGELLEANADGTAGKRLYNFKIASPSYSDVRKFVAANQTHIRDSEFSESQHKWIHATRFWSVVAGFVATSKSTEYVEVEDPADDAIPDSVDDIAQFIVAYAGNAWTAAAARATSWRKSNHATGGDIATGFPRRWLQKEQLWPTDRDRNRQLAAARQVTSAYYVATHASSVHAVLALMAPKTAEHWAKINPKYGIILGWDVKESALIRMAPNTQVAGVAMVTDAVVCLKMLVREGLAPLLESFSQHAALAAAHELVESSGMRAASYARWFLDGHPRGISPVSFNQKDSTYAELVGELGAVATTYYKGSTIGESPALENAAKQMAPETARQTWSSLSKAKKSMAPTEMFRVYGRIKGASTSMTATSMLSTDEAERTSAVDQYNHHLATIATAFKVASYPEVKKESIEANAEAADAQARAMDSLLASAGQAT